MNNNVKNEIKRLERSIRRLKKKTEKLERGIVNRLDKSYQDVINAIHQKLETKKTLTLHSSMCRVNDETGELIDFLVYFPDSSTVNRVRDYLEAYLIINRDVLEEDKIGELEGLIRYFM